MDKRDLMLNDCVRTKLNDSDNWHEDKVGLLDIENDEIEYEPVTITEERLTRHGFIKGVTNHAMTFDKTISKDDKWYYIGIVIPKGKEEEWRWDTIYVDIESPMNRVKLKGNIAVHELQNAMRVVGLKDFADNF